MPLQNKFEHCARNARARSGGACAQKTRLIKFFIESLLLPKYVMLKKSRTAAPLYGQVQRGCRLYIRKNSGSGHKPSTDKIFVPP